MSPRGIVRTAVFPVGGLGTGILPATKAAPKELLAVVDKPLIHYAVEEAPRAGARRMIFVTNRNKRAIEDHFDKAYELERTLALQKRDDVLAELRRLFPSDVAYLFVRQPDRLGLAHAIGCARTLVAEEPFLVILPDELVDPAEPGAAQLVDAFGRFGCPVVAAAPADGGGNPLGFVEGFAFTPRLYRVTRVRGPSSGPSSSLAIAGRFVFTPEIFAHLATTPSGPHGEIEIADALQSLLAAHPMFACELAGERFDCGSKLGLLSATLHFGLRHPVLGEPFAALVRAAADARLMAPPTATNRTLSAVRAVND